MSEGISLSDGLKKLETIMSVHRENLKKLKGATEIEFIVENLLENQIQISIAIETILVAFQRIIEKNSRNSLDS